MSQWILFFLSLTELVLLAFVILFFLRLKRSEEILDEVQQKQAQFLAKLHFNAELEAELVSSFEERQRELTQLDANLAQRAKEMEELLGRAEKVVRSPDTLRQTILKGKRDGRSNSDLARLTGLSLDEVELILMQGR